MSLKDFYALITRLFLGYVFFSSGLCKLVNGQFGQFIGPPHLISELAAHGLGLFGVFLAFAQVLTGALVLSQRWSVLGLIMLLPMNACILAATISMGWQGTPFVNAFLLIINALALLYEWKSIRFLLFPAPTMLPISARTHVLFPNIWMPTGVILSALLAASIATISHTATMMCGLSALILAWANVWSALRNQFWVKVALSGALCVVLMVSLSVWEIPALYPAVLGFAIAVLGTLVFTFKTAKRDL